MNRNLERAIEDIRKTEALMFAYEQTYLDVESDIESFETTENRQYAFYAIVDFIKTVSKDIDRLTEDTRIVDVVEAIARTN